MLQQAEQIVAHSVAAEEGKTPVIITESSSIIRKKSVHFQVDSLSLVSFYLHTVFVIYLCAWLHWGTPASSVLHFHLLLVLFETFLTGSDKIRS